MQFRSFRIAPVVEVFYADEGVIKYGISQDQDAALMARVKAFAEADCELPDDVELVWAVGDTPTVAFRLNGQTNETEVSGDFYGFGEIIEAEIDNGDGTVTCIDMEVDQQKPAADVCVALNALIADKTRSAA